MKKTKVLAVVAGLSMFALMAVGSGSSDSGSKKEITAQTEAAEKETGNKAENKAENETEAVKETETSAQAAGDITGDITIEEQVLYEQDGIRVTALSYEHDSIWGDGIKLLIENDTDRNVTISSDVMIVNDYMSTSYIYEEVAAGKKATDTAYFLDTMLDEAGITAPGQIEFNLRAYDSDTWDDIWRTDCITLTTSAYDTMVVPDNSDGQPLYEGNGIKIVGKSVDEDDIFGASILLYLENTSDRKVCVYVDNMSVNGFMIDPVFAADLYPGKKSLDEITLMSSNLEESGIESIDDVELSFRIVDEDTYDTIDTTYPISFSAQ